MNKQKIKLFVLAPFLACIVAMAGCETALEKPLEKGKVILTAPADSVIATDTTQTFYWEKKDGALHYQLQIVSPDFNRIEQMMYDTTVVSNRFTTQLDKGTYQWRVKATNNSSATPYSYVNTLYIQ